MENNEHVFAPVTIEDGAVIGTRSIILPGFTIGAGSVVGAGSTVTQNVPAHTVVFGAPARKIKTLTPAEKS